MGIKKCMVLLLLIFNMGLCLARDTFLKSYNIPNQTITRVSKIELLHSNPPYAVALEGVNNITNEFFTRVQAFDYQGNLAEGYEDAFVGNPLTVSSGMFLTGQFYDNIMFPLAEYSTDSLRYYLRWQVSGPDTTYMGGFNGIFLPDSIRTLYEFPAAVNNHYSKIFASRYYLIAGRASVNNVNRCFSITADDGGQNLYDFAIYYPGLNFICGVARTDEGYLAIGRSTSWNGKAVFTDLDGNVVWSLDFTDAADTAFEPYFTTPLINTMRYWEDENVVVSYQNRDRAMHLAKLKNQGLEEFFSLQLDSYVGAIPLVCDEGTVTFCYLLGGQQYISQCDFLGNLLWTTELPGGGKFGRNSLNYIDAVERSRYLVSGAMPGGGFYLAAVNAWDGSIDNDTVHIPEVSDVRFYPNPAGEWINMEIDVKQSGRVKIALYNIKGQKVSTFVDENRAPGQYKGRWNLGANNNNVNNSGLYILHSEINGKKFTQKLILHPDNEEGIPPTSKRSH
jgi:hypothetical protein